jgi:hypothetical protein
MKQKFIAFLSSVLLMLASISGAGYSAGEDTGKKPVPGQDRMIAYYCFNQDAKDYSGFGNHGTVRGNIAYSQAVAAKGARFDGSGYIEVVHRDSLQVDKGFSMSGWFKLEEAKGQNLHAVLAKQGNGTEDTGDAYDIAIDCNNHFGPVAGYRPFFGAYCTGEGAAAGANGFMSMAESKMMPGTWAMLTVTFDGKSVSFYADGKLLKTEALEKAGVLVHSEGKLVIGKLDFMEATYFAKGIFDELRLYNYALDEASIAKLYTLRDRLIVRRADGTVPAGMKVKQSIQLNTKLSAYLFIADKAVPGTGKDSFKESPITGAIYKTLTPKLATVDAGGKVTALAKGKATIKITYKEITEYLNITIN